MYNDVKKNEFMRLSNQVKELMFRSGKIYCSHCHRYYSEWLYDDELRRHFYSHERFELTEDNSIKCRCNVSGRMNAILITGKEVEDKSGLIMSSLKRLSESLKIKMAKTEIL